MKHSVTFRQPVQIGKKQWSWVPLMRSLSLPDADEIIPIALFI
jgi:hypothetical protein